jgi:hypothetical protein
MDAFIHIEATNSLGYIEKCDQTSIVGAIFRNRSLQATALGIYSGVQRVICSSNTQIVTHI